MKLSVMIRGNNFLEADRFGFPMDGRDNVKSLLEKIVQPVRSLNPGARIFLVTYPSAALDEIKAALEPCELVLLDPKGSSQIETFKHGIKHIFEQDDCDAVLSVRFDLEFKKSFYSWDLQLSDDAIYSRGRNIWRPGAIIAASAMRCISLAARRCLISIPG